MERSTGEQPQNPANRAGEERFVVESQRWKRQMRNIGCIVRTVGIQAG